MYTHIAADGVYSIEANVDASTSSNNVKLNNMIVGSTVVFPSTPPVPNTIVFTPTSGGGFIGSLDNISLIDKTNYFTSGGSIGSFTTSGFDPLLNNYIDFDAINETVIFNDAPLLLPPVQLEQAIPNLNTGENYRLKFNHIGITGVISGYYFNAAGAGFRFVVPSGTGLYQADHTVGDSSISSGELTNTLVFHVTTGPVNGALDNISLQQVFTGFEALTVSYSESVRGWVSFKSFILEQGYSLANNYYTFKNGGLFMHNSKAVSRNQFYGSSYPTSITTVLNIEPSTVKSFNTINYEGSQNLVGQ